MCLVKLTDQKYWLKIWKIPFNLFYTIGLFLYPVKTSKNLFSYVFRGFQKRSAAWICLNSWICRIVETVDSADWKPNTLLSLKIKSSNDSDQRFGVSFKEILKSLQNFKQSCSLVYQSLVRWASSKTKRAWSRNQTTATQSNKLTCHYGQCRHDQTVLR